MRRTSQGGSKATTWGRATRSRCNKATGPTADGACPDCSEEDEPDDCYDGDQKKRKNKPLGFFFKQWLEQYNMDNPANLNECPRVEFWTDTKWEPYKEDIQQTIRGHLTTDREDFREFLEITIDLDEAAKSGCTKRSFSQRPKCPPKYWISGRRI